MDPDTIILSPHFDDAVLSCWHLLASAGEVLVVNVFAGEPPAGTLGWWDELAGASDSAAAVRQRADFGAAVSFARGLEGIDADAVAVWGFSSGGGLAIYTAADDHRIAAAIALCPATDTIALLRRMPMRTLHAVNVAILRNMLGRQRVHIPVAGRPGSKAWFSQPEALPGFDAIRGDHSLWRNEYLPLSFAGATSFRAVRVAHRVRCPLFVCIGEEDHVVPRRAAERTVERAPRGERGVYPIDHFGGFLGEGFERVVADQIEFLSRHLLTVQTPGPRAIS
jgi:pimeloyl-ACP methyl ester carboxylesterase